MLGINFENCNDFALSFTFDNCQLNHSTFYGMKIQKTIFKNAQLQEVDFTMCNLENSVFENCNLSGAVFASTNLQKVDFRSAVHYSIHPEENLIKSAKFSQLGIAGLLNHLKIIID